MSEDEYSYSCVVYNKGDQEDSENMDPVSTYLFESLLTQYGRSQSEKKLGVGDKYHCSIKVHT